LKGYVCLLHWLNIAAKRAEVQIKEDKVMIFGNETIDIVA